MGKQERLNDIISVIDRILAGHVYKTWIEAFSFLCFECEEYEISLRFNYHSGWFVKPTGKDGDGLMEYGEPYLDDDSRGYTIEVGLTSFQNDDGTEAFYRKPSWAVHDGLRLLKARLEERL